MKYSLKYTLLPSKQRYQTLLITTAITQNCKTCKTKQKSGQLFWSMKGSKASNPKSARIADAQHNKTQLPQMQTQSSHIAQRQIQLQYQIQPQFQIQSQYQIQPQFPPQFQLQPSIRFILNPVAPSQRIHRSHNLLTSLIHEASSNIADVATDQICDIAVNGVGSLIGSLFN